MANEIFLTYNIGNIKTCLQIFDLLTTFKLQNIQRFL